MELKRAMATSEATSNEVTTTDLDCAAYLIAEGAELAALEEMEFSGRRISHLRGARVQQGVDDYVLGRATVRLDAFRDARRALLDRLHRAERVR
ncbi:MAG: hypothetical protein M3T56_04890 [Chloroflexota bacterium]|nr:hypothetical protein [Chloroflexota bacterium]